MKKVILLLTIIISTTINAQTFSTSLEDKKIEEVNLEFSLKSSTLIITEDKTEINKELLVEVNKIEFSEALVYNIYKKLLSKRRKIMYC
ncbi:hypothetical protein [Polaribacter sp. Asnod1-A03]|uniref:hypothetical protein n=1 Tax=Polaribacter sp. Asnod1-A03 TaxID=3160581 RepID=UPI00386FC2D5